MPDKQHYTEEGTGFVVDGPDAVAEARKRHHLASADPEQERGDGTLTGPAHEEKYGLDRAEGSAEYWRSVGVHPTENRALREDELETTQEKRADENTASSRAAKK